MLTKLNQSPALNREQQNYDHQVTGVVNDSRNPSFEMSSIQRKIVALGVLLIFVFLLDALAGVIKAFFM